MNAIPASSPASRTFAGGYGMSITLAEAKTCAGAAAGHATDIGVPMVIAVTDAAGQLLPPRR